MSDSAHRLPARPSLSQLRKQAKDLLRAARGGDPAACARIGKRQILTDAQLAIAREHGFASWAKLTHYVESVAGGFELRPLIRPVEMTDDVYAMFVAARSGDLATVRQLVARAPALATVEYNYTPPIHFAVREGHGDIAELLLDRGADPAYKSYPFSETLLGFAEDRGHADVAALLRERLSRRFGLAADDLGDTALHHAAKAGDLRVAEALLDAGADIDAVRGDGYRPIHSALLPNWFMYSPSKSANAMADFLLARGARYTIFIAALRGDDQYVRDALKRDRSLANFEDTCHQRVLSAAVRREDVAMTRLLLEHGADPNLPEEGAPQGVSLWTAVDRRHRELVELLLAAGADPNTEVESSGTPMGHNKDQVIAELLRKHGGREANPDSARERVQRLMKEGKLEEAEKLLRANPKLIHDEDAEFGGWGDGILAGPAHAGKHDVIAMLMRLGARVPPVSKWAPYYYFKHEATAEFLLQQGMDPNHMNWHRFTLLHHMAAEGEIAKAKLLIDHGADIDAIDEEYRSTPLGVAARRGQMKAVTLLLERGADPIAAGAPWATPLAWARAKGHHDIETLLTISSPSPAP